MNKRKKPNPQRINTLMKKWAHKLNRYFSKEEVQMASKYMKKCFNFPCYNGDASQNYTKISFHSVRMAIFKGNNNNKCCDNGAKQELLYILHRDAN
jgi:hypothetical protein